MFPSYSNQSSSHCIQTNHLTGFYMMGTLVVKGLKAFRLYWAQRIMILGRLLVQFIYLLPVRGPGLRDVAEYRPNQNQVSDSENQNTIDNSF